MERPHGDQGARLACSTSSKPSTSSTLIFSVVQYQTPPRTLEDLTVEVHTVFNLTSRITADKTFLMLQFMMVNLIAYAGGDSSHLDHLRSDLPAPSGSSPYVFAV
jgi:hypothetical protein